jgi:hypothetical protein
MKKEKKMVVKDSFIFYSVLQNTTKDNIMKGTEKEHENNQERIRKNV